MKDDDEPQVSPISVVPLLLKGVPHSRLVQGFVEELRRQFRVPPPD